jgi:hypothetical protein
MTFVRRVQEFSYCWIRPQRNHSRLSLSLSRFIKDTERLNAPPVPTKKQAKDKGKGPHKRQISEAIPRAEREIERAPVTGQDATQAGTRKSARPRKPKSRE